MMWNLLINDASFTFEESDYSELKLDKHEKSSA